MKERMQAMTQNHSNLKGQTLKNLPEVNNANNRVLTNLAIPHLDSFNLSIVRSDIHANNFELKPVMF